MIFALERTWTGFYGARVGGYNIYIYAYYIDDEWPECIFHHVGSQSASYLLSVQCEV